MFSACGPFELVPAILDGGVISAAAISVCENKPVHRLRTVHFQHIAIFGS